MSCRSDPAPVPELDEDQARTLRDYIRGEGDFELDPETRADALIEEAFGNRSHDGPRVGTEPVMGEVGMNWETEDTGRQLAACAAEDRHVWDLLTTKLKEQLQGAEDPPRWLLVWAAEAFTGIRQPISGPGSGRGRAMPRRIIVERAGEVVECLKTEGFTAEAARNWIVENVPEHFHDPESLRRALQRMKASRDRLDRFW